MDLDFVLHNYGRNFPKDWFNQSIMSNIFMANKNTFNSFSTSFPQLRVEFSSNGLNALQVWLIDWLSLIDKLFRQNRHILDCLFCHLFLSVIATFIGIWNLSLGHIIWRKCFFCIYNVAFSTYKIEFDQKMNLARYTRNGKLWKRRKGSER